ncbi:MAG: GNAT family N-acetyltransferase [Chloroflexi bacterium]|nr:GNAT family N-acetyltransferase [Chloroflexota bacterium]
MTNGVSIQRVAVEVVRPLRAQVLRPGQPLERNIYPGDDAPDTVHFAALLEGRVVGSASVFHQPPPDSALPTAWRLRGVTTLPDVRGRGFGVRLVEACVTYVRQQNGTYLWFFANPPAVGFYENLGFQQHPDMQNVVEVGPPHPLMGRRL